MTGGIGKQWSGPGADPEAETGAEEPPPRANWTTSSASWPTCNPSSARCDASQPPDPTRPAPALRSPLLPGCAFFGIERTATAPTDPSEVIYRAAMADLSACVIRARRRNRRRRRGRATLQADTRPTNPDHFT